MSIKEVPDNESGVFEKGICSVNLSLSHDTGNFLLILMKYAVKHKIRLHLDKNY